MFNWLRRKPSAHMWVITTGRTQIKGYSGKDAPELVQQVLDAHNISYVIEFYVDRN